MDKAEGYRTLKLRHAKLVEHGKDFVIKEFIDGVRGDQWVKDWAKRHAFAQNLPPVRALSDLFFDIAGKNAHIIDLNRKNLIWVEAEQAWVIVDSGKLCLDERFEDSLFTYREAVRINWGKDLLKVDVALKHLACNTINAKMDQALRGRKGLRNIQYPDGPPKSG